MLTDQRQWETARGGLASMGTGYLPAHACSGGQSTAGRAPRAVHSNRGDEPEEMERETDAVRSGALSPKSSRSGVPVGLKREAAAARCADGHRQATAGRGGGGGAATALVGVVGGRRALG